MRLPPRSTVAVLAVLLAAACAAEPARDAPPASAAPVPSATAEPAAADGGLLGTEWVLVSLGGVPAAPRPPVTLLFEDTTFGGYGGCNWMGGRYAAGADTLRVWDLSSTARACGEPGMGQETRFDRALRGVRRFRLAADTLRLRDGSGQVLLELRRRRWAEMDPGRLVGTRWRLVALGDGPPPAGRPITLAFSRDSIRGHAGCRDYEGTYHARGSRFGRTSLSMLQTECPDPRRLQAEGNFIGALSESSHFQLRGDSLLLYAVSGEVLRFARDGQGGTEGAAGGLSVALDRGEYLLRPVRAAGRDGASVVTHRELRIIATYTNRSARPVFPAPCGKDPPSVELEKRVGERWERAYEWSCELPRPCELPALAPGSSRTDTVVFRDHGPRAYPRFVIDSIPGTYRLAYGVYGRYSGCDGPAAAPDSLVPADASRSAPFRVLSP